MPPEIQTGLTLSALPSGGNVYVWIKSDQDVSDLRDASVMAKDRALVGQINEDLNIHLSLKGISQLFRPNMAKPVVSYKVSSSHADLLRLLALRRQTTHHKLIVLHDRATGTLGTLMIDLPENHNARVRQINEDLGIHLWVKGVSHLYRPDMAEPVASFKVSSSLPARHTGSWPCKSRPPYTSCLSYVKEEIVNVLDFFQADAAIGAEGNTVVAASLSLDGRSTSRETVELTRLMADT
jgi:hypothetical protein